MWTQLLSIAALITVARGMCFGVPLLQQPVACPEPMVYYPQLCICIEPKHKEKLHESGTLRRLPILDVDYPRQTFKDKLQALRYRMSASLPDMVNHGHGSSFGSIKRQPLILFPDRFIGANSHLSPLFNNQVPRSWKIGGLLEHWSNDAFANAGEIPTIQSAQKDQSPSWGEPTDGMGSVPLTLMDRLQILRDSWREISRSRAQMRLGDNALASRFLDRLPSAGVSPDTSKWFFRLAAGVPEMHPSAFLQDVQVAETEKGNSLLSMKEAALVKPHLDEPIPPKTSKRPNSYLRSLMRLKKAKGL